MLSTFEDEKRMQPFMDEWYKSQGFWSIDRSKSCKQYDCIIFNGRELRSEEKYLFTRVHEKVLIEILQDVIKPDLGWFYHVNCDHLYWIYCYEDRRTGIKHIYKLHWEKLKTHVLETLNIEGFKSFNLCNRNYGATLNYPIYWNTLLGLGIAQSFPINNNDDNIDQLSLF